VPQVIDLVAGARPNFVKLAPVERAIRASGRLSPRIVHTGQHYDAAMNDVFFRDLAIPAPDVCLEVGSGSQGWQTARILERFETHLLGSRPAAVVVFGDVNSTIACALAAVKLGVPVCHVEAGLRSFDRAMPEEINRVLTDAISGLLLVSEPSGLRNLDDEGISRAKVRLVGNVMVDTLLAELPKARDRAAAAALSLDRPEFGLITLHRPSNVDDPATLRTLMHVFHELAGQLPFIFPMHPRTRAAAERIGFPTESIGGSRLLIVDPLPYHENIGLMSAARVVLTDSGGVQEEASVLGVPCLTLRANTERPITVEVGTNRLVGSDPEQIRHAFAEALAGRWPRGRDIPLWDGAASERVVQALCEWCDSGWQDVSPRKS
jgi:UDP-N-acetylglucosamine 2-epimerase (non-hydrolysing)